MRQAPFQKGSATMTYPFLEQTFSKLKEYKRIHEVNPLFQPRLKIKMKSSMPESLKLAWDLAVFETESNLKSCPYGGEYFTAGGRGGWHNMLFGQDTVGTALLSFNRLYPDEMKKHIRAYVLARLNIGFMCPNNWVLENCSKSIGLDMDAWVPDSREFIERYFMSPALNRTGMDVGWIWAAGDLFDTCGDRMDWGWLFGMGELFFEHFYQPFFDEKDGLYFGQASFIDVGGNGYPPAFGNRDQKSRNAGVWIKASSTNALYVRSMDVLSHAAKVLGRKADADKWQNRANALRKAIRDHLRFPDGSFTYFMNRDGRLEERREALGAAFCILADVVTGEEALRALAFDKLPQSKAGVALFYPFYEDNPKCYHNRSAWPFASTFYYMACEKVTGKSYLEPDAIQLANAITVPDRASFKPHEIGSPEDYLTGTFKEVVNYETELPIGVSAQSWTLAAFFNLCLRHGWVDADLPCSRFW